MSHRKLASQVAADIRKDVIAMGWPVGRVLGGEQDLIARYAVSRAVLREALRIVEYLGIARMRQGPGGGLVVTAPDATAATVATLIYFAYRGVRLDEVLAARSIVEEMSVELATKRSTTIGRARVRASVADAPSSADGEPLDGIHAVLAVLTENPAITLFVTILQRVTAQYAKAAQPSQTQLRRQQVSTANAHLRISDAVETGDSVLARLAMRHHLEEVERSLLSSGAPTTIRFDGEDRDLAGAKLSGHVAMDLCATIIDRGWPLGEQLGNEEQLLSRFEISRAVLREAIRLLEFYGVVHTRRGPGGGLFVAEPSIDAVTETIAVHLDFRQIDKQALYEVRSGLELATVERVVTAQDEGLPNRLRTALQESKPAAGKLPDAVDDLHARIAELSGNRAVWMLMLVLIRLTEERGLPLDADMATAIQRAHAGIVSAITDRNPDQAARRMQRHLDALALKTRSSPSSGR